MEPQSKHPPKDFDEMELDMLLATKGSYNKDISDMKFEIDRLKARNQYLERQNTELKLTVNRIETHVNEIAAIYHGMGIHTISPWSSAGSNKRIRPMMSLSVSPVNVGTPDDEFDAFLDSFDHIGPQDIASTKG